MRQRFVYFIWIVWCFRIIAGNAQHPVFRQITDEQGLPSNEVYDLFRDRDGFIWAGTDNGLCRYDGYEFQYFSSPLQSGRGMTDIQQDRQGRIWCHNFNGQIFWIEKNKMFLLEEYKKPKTALANFVIDSVNNILYAVNKDKGIFVYDLIQNKPKPLLLTQKKSDKDPDAELITLAPLYGNRIGISTYLQNYGVLHNGHLTPIVIPDSLYILQSDGTRLAPYAIPFSIGNRVFFYEKLSDRLLEARNGKLIVAKEHFFSSYGLGVYATIQPADKGQVWLCSFQGALCIDDALNPVSQQLRLFPDWAISDIIRDQEGNLWISTLKNGICFLPNFYKKSFFRVTLSHSGNSSLPFSSVTALAPYRGQEMLIGFANGTGCIWDAAKGQVVRRFALPTERAVTGFALAPDGHILMNNNDLHELNSNGKILKFINNSVRNIQILADGRLFVAGGGYAYTLPPNGGKNSQWKGFLRLKDRGGAEAVVFREARCNDIWYDERQQTVWAMYADELMKHYADGRSDTLQFYGHPVYGTALAAYPAGNVVACGTVSDGVLLFYADGKMEQLSEKQQLPSVSIRKIHVFNDSQLWILHQKGISVYDLVSKTLRNFTQSDGIYERDLYDIAVVQGMVYVATPRGILSFDDDWVGVNAYVPKVYITSLKAGDKALNISQIPVISYPANDVRISFSTPLYRGRLDTRFRYRLLGSGDTTWLTVGREVTELRFPSLPPGSYHFQLKASNEDGVTSPPVGIRFEVEAPFWQRWWFLGGIMLLIASLIWAGFTLRLRVQKRQNTLALAKAKAEADLRDSQLSSLKVQMNPHFIFNALNSIQDFMMSNEKKQANLYLGKFSDLMRMTLDMSQKATVSLSDELKVLRIYLDLESLRFEDNLTWKIIVNDSIDADEIMIPSMLIQPYVENAIKHGLLHKKTDKQLTVDFCLNAAEDALLCTIDDNGVGRARSEELKQFRPHKHTSFASSATQTRLELLNYGRKKTIAVQYTDKKDDQGHSMGTRVTIEVPFVK